MERLASRNSAVVGTARRMPTRVLREHACDDDLGGVRTVDTEGQ